MSKHIRHFFQSFGYSIAGFSAAFKHEIAFRQEIFFFCILTPLALLLGDNGVKQALLIGSLMLVLIVELFNSAVEAVVDRISKERHPLAGRAKDLASAAVFLAIVNTILTWGLVLLHT
ncbi:MAG: diacylglycerol kinase [Candidatus Electrothrix sp. AR3]|nr:diacylglycerol kinase [Candidatus Electrothrix sp. AR3]